MVKGPTPKLMINEPISIYFDHVQYSQFISLYKSYEKFYILNVFKRQLIQMTVSDNDQHQIPF